MSTIFLLVGITAAIAVAITLGVRYFPRLQCVRNTHSYTHAVGDGDDSRRSEIAAEIHHTAHTIAATWVLFTKETQLVSVPVATTIVKWKSRRRASCTMYNEILYLSSPVQIYPIHGNYNLGIDSHGDLYYQAYRRNMALSCDVRPWMRLEDVAESRISTAVLEHHLLRYLQAIYAH